MEDEYPKDYFVFVRRLLIVSGIWIPKFRTSFWYKMYGYFVISVVSVFHTALEGVVLKETYKDLDAIVKTLSMFGQHALGSIKTYVWIRNTKIIVNIINTLEDEKYHYKACSSFQPGATTKTYKKYNQYITGFYFTTAINVALSATFAGFFNYLSTPNFISIPIKGIYAEKLPFYIWTPFDITGSEQKYQLVFWFQAYGVLMNAVIITALDQLFINLLRILTCHVVILQGALRTIRERAVMKVEGRIQDDFGNNSAELEEQMFVELRKCIKHSQVLVRICEDVERIYKYIVLTQYVTTTIMSCTTLFVVSSISIASSRFVAEISYLSAIYVQISCVSWIGHQLFAEWSVIPDAIYETDWYGASTKYKKTLTFMMRRFLNPIFISIGNFAPLSLPSLVSVIRISYSFFALIKNGKD